MEKQSLKRIFKPLLFCAWLLSLMPVVGHAQQVVGTAGTVFENENMSISWTIGETVIETLMHDNGILTQGFHQPTLSVVSVEDLVELNFNIQAFPNPTRDFLILRMDEMPPKPLNYMVYNLSGQLIQDGMITDLQTRISFESYQSAFYIIQIRKENKPVKAFKISKTQ